MADDPSQSVADPSAADSNIIPSPESASASADRPFSTILADSPPAAATPLADLATDYTPPAVPADPPVATESATIAVSPVSVPADFQEPTMTEPSATVPTEVQGEISPPSPPQPAPQEAPAPSPESAEEGSIPVSSLPNEPSQVQPVVSEGASVSQVPEKASQSAEIKLGPLEGTQNAPLADSEAPVSPKSSFGDLVSDQPEPVSPPVSPQLPQSPQAPISSPSTPKTSFGDLVGIPPVEEPTITIQPIEVPKPVQSPQSPVSPQSPLSSDLSAEASAKVEAPAKEGISLQTPTETVIEAKADFSYKRQQALQVRRKKREGHLATIVSLVARKGKISNNDVRDLLRVSQSTASEYLRTLVKDGKIKKEGKAKATVYSL